MFTLMLLSALIAPIFSQCPANSVPLPVGGRCRTNIQCENQAPGYKCVQGICCSDGTNVIYTVPYGGYCVINNQCRLKNSACLNNRCVCANQFIYIGQRCIPVITNCATNEVSIHGSCHPKVGYGGRCQYTEQCSYDAARCNAGQCGCDRGSVYITNKCIPLITPGPECNSNQILIEEQCFSKSTLGQSCFHSQQCLNFNFWFDVKCLNGICMPAFYNHTWPSCRRQDEQVEIMNGVVKNCLHTPCKVGYFCEYDKNINNGQYICCGHDIDDAYGIIRILPGTGKPLQCNGLNSCPYVNTPNCVMSSRYGYNVCCSTNRC